MFPNNVSILPSSSGLTLPRPRLAITCANCSTSYAKHFRLLSTSSLPIRTRCTGALSRPSTSMSLSLSRCSILWTQPYSAMTSTHPLLSTCGNSSATRYANEDAISLLLRSLGLLALLPTGSKRDIQELSLQLALAPLYRVTTGWAHRNWNTCLIAPSRCVTRWVTVPRGQRRSMDSSLSMLSKLDSKKCRLSPTSCISCISTLLVPHRRLPT